MRQRPDHHDHLTTFHLGHVLDLAQFLDVVRHAVQQIASKFLVGHFAPAETQSDLYLVAILKKLEDIAHFDIVVICVRVRAELDLFDFNDFLLFARFAFAFLLFVFVFAEVHDLTDRRAGVGRNFNEVQPRVVGHVQRPVRADNADILSICADQADLVGTDAVVYARARFTLRGRVVRSASYDLCPSIVAPDKARKLTAESYIFKLQIADLEGVGWIFPLAAR